MDIYYVYEYVREDGSPYYVGKGKGRRAWDLGSHSCGVPPQNRIRFVAKNLSEETALRLEKELILLHGRKDLGTGILRNLTNGGEGTSGMRHTAKSKALIGKGQRGKPKSREAIEKRLATRKANNKPVGGWKRSAEANKKLSEALTGKAKTVEHNAKVAASNKTLVTCPHCSKQGGRTAMARWHFDNCRHAASTCS